MVCNPEVGDVLTWVYPAACGVCRNPKSVVVRLKPIEGSLDDWIMVECLKCGSRDLLNSRHELGVIIRGSE